MDEYQGAELEQIQIREHVFWIRNECELQRRCLHEILQLMRKNERHQQMDKAREVDLAERVAIAVLDQLMQMERISKHFDL